MPIFDNVAILPLIGNIDARRAKHIQDNVIPKVSSLKLDYLILDLSGIQLMDEQVADHLFKIYNILSLIGIHTVLTGIRPEMAQVAIGLGLNFSTIKTYLNVQQALQQIDFKKREGPQV